MKRFAFAVVVAACGSARPATVSSEPVPVLSDVNELGPWLPRRPLPAQPTRADVVCIDAHHQVQLDVVPNPRAPTATFVEPDHLKICEHGACRLVPYLTESGGTATTAVTDGTYVAVEANQRVDVYRASDGQHLYQLSNTIPSDTAGTEFTCGTVGFLGASLLSNGHDCGGPIGFPFLADAATGRTLGLLAFAGEGADSLPMRAVHLGGARWAIVGTSAPSAEQPSCTAILNFDLTMVVEEHSCEPASFMLLPCPGVEAPP